MNTYRCNPDGIENQSATIQAQREVFSLQMLNPQTREDAYTLVLHALQISERAIAAKNALIAELREALLLVNNPGDYGTARMFDAVRAALERSKP